jgi:hypothetical protein
VDSQAVQSDHLHTLSNQLPRKTTRKDGPGLNHLKNRQAQSTDTKKESSVYKVPAVKSSISLEMQKKDHADVVKPLPPPLVRMFASN